MVGTLRFAHPTLKDRNRPVFAAFVSTRLLTNEEAANGGGL
jgi:hypothetical protein